MLDLAQEEREVSTENAEKFVEEKKLDGFIEASAKTANNVNEVFIKIAEVLHKKKLERDALEPKKETPAPMILTTNKSSTTKKGCC